MSTGKKMTRWEIIKTLRKHGKLSDERNPAITQNKVAKVLGYVMFGFMILYLMFFAVMFSLIANSTTRYTACEMIFGMMPFILTVDFLMRFLVQQTPSQRIKPYILLPISKYVCIDSFLFNSITSWGNLVWMALFIPYAIMSILFVEGFSVVLAFLLATYLLIIANSQWYMLSRTMILKSFYWWLLPIAVYALIFSPWYLGHEAGIMKLCKTYAVIGDGVSHWSPLVFLGILLLIVVLIAINRRLQFYSIYSELSRNEKTTIKHVTELNQLDRFGLVGEYLKMEVKSIMRNKNIRKGFITAIILIVVFSVLISFTDIYAGGMTKFLVVYNFAIVGAMLLIKVMCYEGNYIDCLMVHKESIMSLLKAKYIFSSALLILPMLLMIPIVVMGKCSLLMLIGIMLLTAGPIHASFLYMSIFNNQTIPLNTKFIGKGGMENNFIQIAVEFGAFLLPLVLINLFPHLFGEIGGAIAIIIIGLTFIALSPVWIRDIYKRMMKRRYKNLESFHASRG